MKENIIISVCLISLCVLFADMVGEIGYRVGYEDGVIDLIHKVNQLNDSTWSDQNIIILLSETDTTLVYSVSN